MIGGVSPCAMLQAGRLVSMIVPPGTKKAPPWSGQPCGASKNPAHWKLRKANKVTRECETLKTQVALLHTEVQHKQNFVGKLEFLIHQRNERINELNDKLAQSREQCRKLDAEADRLAALFQTWRDWWTPPKN